MAVVGGGVVAWLALGSLPQTAGQVRLPGLSAPVTISRDAYAVPHIEATSVADAYRAMGYVHAQDRLWQMEFNRRLGQGRLAEILGEDGLAFDRFMRTLGLAHVAESSLAAVRPDVRRVLDAYAEGINGFLAGGPRLPPEFLILRHRPEPWRAADSLLLLKLMALDLGGSWRQDLLRGRLAGLLPPDMLADLWPDAEPSDPVTLTAAARLLGDLQLADAEEPLTAGPPPIGSNWWLVNGERSATGAPLLANDPHLDLSLPGVWYLARITAPGLDVIGATLPMVPFVILGRNHNIAWGFTNTGSDVQDVFVESLDPDDPDRYLAPGGAEPFVTRVETLKVRGGEPQSLRVRATRHGPVISDVLPGRAPSGAVLALAWTGLDPADRTVEAGYDLATASDWSGFVAALETFVAPQQNVAYADRTGRIGALVPGHVPIRAGGDGRLPVAGSDGRHDWIGRIPYAELPRRLDPPAGQLLNANNRIVGVDYPHFLAASWEVPYRAQRIAELLDAAGSVHLDTMQAVQLDQVSPFARALVALLPAPGDGDTAEEAALLRALRTWDGRMAPDRPEPLILAAFQQALGPLLWGDELAAAGVRSVRHDAMLRMLKDRQGWCDDVRTGEVVETCEERMRLGLRQAVETLRPDHGADWRQWRWDAAHRMILAHRPFEQVPALAWLFSQRVPAGGSGTTVNVASHEGRGDGAPFEGAHAPSYRAIYDLGGLVGSRFIIPGGQSGHPLSPHYRDLTALWRRGDYLPMRLGEPASATSRKPSLRLLP